jgi:hypothetical protein
VLSHIRDAWYSTTLKPGLNQLHAPPLPSFVLLALGRGGGTNNYCGNVAFRKLVDKHKMRYLAVSKVEKPNVAREVVAIWRKLCPPGRFLAKLDDPNAKKEGNDSSPIANINCTARSVSDGDYSIPLEAVRSFGSPLAMPGTVWVEVGDKKAREKASQCLRERTPDVLPIIQKMKQKNKQMKSSVTMGRDITATTSPESSPVSRSPKRAVCKVGAQQGMSRSSSPAAAAIAVALASETEQLATGESEKHEPSSTIIADGSTHSTNSKARARPMDDGRPSKAAKAPRLDDKAKAPRLGDKTKAPRLGDNTKTRPASKENNNQLAPPSTSYVGQQRKNQSATGDLTLSQDIRALSRNRKSNCAMSHEPAMEHAYMEGMAMDPASAQTPMMNGSLGRRNSMPADCSPQHAPSCMSRRGSLPIGMQSSLGPMSPAAEMAMAMNNPAMMNNPFTAAGGFMPPFSSNATGYMPLHGMGKGIGGAVDMGYGSSLVPGAFGGSFGMSQMEAAAFHNSFPVMDHSIHSCPSHSMAASIHSFQQSQLILQQMQIEQHCLQEQIDHQMQLEQEMRLHLQQQRLMGAGTIFDSLPPHSHLQHMHVSRQDAPGFPPLASMDPVEYQRQTMEGSYEEARRAYEGSSSREQHGSDPPTTCLKPDYPLQVPNASAASRVLRANVASVTVSPDTLRDIIPTESPIDMPPSMTRNMPREGDAVESKTSLRRGSRSGDPPGDPDGVMTLAEYRQTLDEYVTNNNIAMSGRIYSDDECSDGQVSDEIMSAQSFDDWRGGHYNRASPAKSPATNAPRNRCLLESRSKAHSTSVRPDPSPSPGRAPLHVRRKNSLRSSFASLSGMSVLSSSDDRDDASTTGKGGKTKNFSSNESIVSEISALSHTIDDLGLGEDE